ncbi:YjiG family protein [Sutterella sp.]|uniref:YjiG family protein n=1 Tax=Sutterella sp. TaxID=1981025 RepID=UPI0026E05EA1|nr:YjiG family protein [Sutterella sp.]MDO5531986.1 YjiG family protein [Sutterella sp.]
MSDTTNTAEKKPSNNPFDIFIVGLRKGLNIGLYSLLPNVLMAFVLTHILRLFGVMDFLGEYCGGVMGIFGLPGEAVTVLLATWLSCGAGVGVAASLASHNTLSPHDITILAPAFILMASQIQYMGRLLGVADVPKKYWPVLMVNSVLMASISMICMRFFV